MCKIWLACLFSLSALMACSDHSSKTVAAIIPRDTTITKGNAYTTLLLDSLMVQAFLNMEVLDPADSLIMQNFYNSRNYQYAWFDEQGLTEQGRAFWNLHEADEQEQRDTLPVSIQLHNHMTSLINADTTGLSPQIVQQTELRLTLHFFNYMNHAFRGTVEPEEIQWYIPRRKIDVKAILDSFLVGNKDSWVATNEPFSRMQKKLVEYARLAEEGGWLPVQLQSKGLTKGDTGNVVKQLATRLMMDSLYQASQPTGVVTDSLVSAIKKAQRSFGLKQTGVVDKELVQLLNVPVGERIKQMKINLERMRWMPDISKDRLLANIPEFNLHVVQNDTEIMTIPIVVGKSANRTVIFSDELEFVVFSPYWNVPESIVRNEIVPAIQKNPNYLSRNNMEKFGTSNGLPMIRQLPGSNNALGKVKFIFPNPYNIYFHDTPAKALFSRQQRAFSHGCMRLQKPVDLAVYLLRNDTSWTKTKILDAMNLGTEKWVTLKNPLSVYIVYFTSWVDADGLLHFRNDVYGHDTRMAEHLFN